MILYALLAPAVAAGSAPVADAGLGVLAYPGDTVVLNGTGSSDADHETLAYTWTQLDGTAVDFVDVRTAEPSFVVPGPGPYRFQLVVNDGTLDSAPAEVSFYAPDREAQPLGKGGGCSSSPAPAGWLLAGLGGILIGRRRRL